jgi:hypothetical protein
MNADMLPNPPPIKLLSSTDSWKPSNPQSSTFLVYHHTPTSLFNAFFTLPITYTPKNGLKEKERKGKKKKILCLVIVI